MMGRRGEQWSLFYQFRLDERVPKDPPTTFWELPRCSDRTPYLVVGSEVAGLARVCQTELMCFLPDEAARVSFSAAIVSTL